MNIRRYGWGALTALLLVLAGCATKLEPGGAYAPADTNGVALAAPDIGLYTCDSAYQIAKGGMDIVVKFERDNRATLWKLDPNIKRTIDQVRPVFWQYNKLYLAGRAAYKENPTPAGLDTMQFTLSKMQQLLAAAQEVVPKN